MRTNTASVTASCLSMKGVNRSQIMKFIHHTQLHSVRGTTAAAHPWIIVAHSLFDFFPARVFQRGETHSFILSFIRSFFVRMKCQNEVLLKKFAGFGARIQRTASSYRRNDEATTQRKTPHVSKTHSMRFETRTYLVIAVFAV